MRLRERRHRIASSARITQATVEPLEAENPRCQRAGDASARPSSLPLAVGPVGVCTSAAPRKAEILLCQSLVRSYDRLMALVVTPGDRIYCFIRERYGTVIDIAARHHVPIFQRGEPSSRPATIYVVVFDDGSTGQVTDERVEAVVVR